MLKKAAHISLAPDKLISRVLNLPPSKVKSWPESVRELALSLAGEIFLLRYNPFIPAKNIWRSVTSRLETESSALTEDYHRFLNDALNAYWTNFQADMAFRDELIARLSEFLPKQSISSAPNALVECSTDATDLRMELPLLVLYPANTGEIQAIIRLANELKFAVIPRGGGSGLTGGAVPGRERTVVLSLTRLKKILRVDPTELILCSQTGVITLDAMKAADKQGVLFTVDPASRAASSLGGNIAENAGGPYAFEYGTTLDNILSYTMVTPLGEIIEIHRVNHPRHKILPEETVEFEVRAQDGRVLDRIVMKGAEIRGPGLGKDVTNKYLSGLPGVQKEGLDGIVTEACFTLHPKLTHSRILCLEFFGRSMHHAVLVIKDLVSLRNRIREDGDLVKISALEEFGAKYVQAIEYRKKSSKYEGDPISVLLLQLDSDHEEALRDAVTTIVNIAEPYDNVDIFVAADAKQAEIFWEDRHKLSAIAKRTSGFKINEDVVIPLEVIPDFSDFIEGLNLIYLAKAYRRALQAVVGLTGTDSDDEFVAMELDFTSDIIKGKTTTKELSDQELEIQIHYFFQDLRNRYPNHREDLDAILSRLHSKRIVVANHMHAGDGNCHVNLPVNSNDPEMIHEAEEAVERVFRKVVELKGGVSGEHGIGITKIAFLPEDKIKAIRAYKKNVDPNNILNPGKLVQRDLPVIPFTFSFNRLIQDLNTTALPGKDILIKVLRDVQTCTRCGKCKQVCPMFCPEEGFLNHPRNKNITYGALIEALYYSQIQNKKPEPELQNQLRSMAERCTACGKCALSCPVKIDSSKVILDLRNYLEEKGQSGHPFKSTLLSFFAANPCDRLPRAAKVLSVGQSIQNRTVGLIPAKWRARMENPIFRGKGPSLGFHSLYDSLSPRKGTILKASNTPADQQALLYFPGCGAGLFYRTIGEASLLLLLKAGHTVVIPPRHLCCGYPLLASGCAEAYAKNREKTIKALRQVVKEAGENGLAVKTLLTSCGTCREALHDFGVPARIPSILTHKDVVQYLFEDMPVLPKPTGPVLYHQPCHMEWTGVPGAKAGEVYAAKLSEFCQSPVGLSPGCCGESGLGAMTSPGIFNIIRERKMRQLGRDLASPQNAVVVGCPSCKIGLTRCLNNLPEYQTKVLHTLEFMAEQMFDANWPTILRSALSMSKAQQGIRILELKSACDI